MFNQDDCISLEKLSEHMPGALIVYKANQSEDIVFASQEIAHIFECDNVNEFLRFTGGSFITVVYPEDVEEVKGIIASQVQQANGYDYVTYRIITKNGRIKRVEDWGHLVHDEALGDVFYVYLHDMDLREQLTGISGQVVPEPQEYSSDELTGLANARFFRAQARGTITHIIKDHKIPACVYINIRNFHTYNEIYGFAGGDRMLCSVGRILRDTFPYCLIARLEGDHFAVIAPDDAIKAKILRLSVRISNIRRGAFVELKAGVVVVKDFMQDISVILDYAHMACERIKHEYGAVVSFYDGSMDEHFHLREHVLSTFKAALNDGSIKVYFQPVVDVASGQVSSYEALVRWFDPTFGQISPANFLYVLEEHMLIHKLDTFVIRTVCAELQDRIAQGKPTIPVSVNLSRLDFELTDVVRVIDDAVKDYSIPKELIRFELTESLIAVDMEAMSREADRLRQHGFHVWMDAFGAGYSSLKVLKDFALDGLKIDMDMIRSLDDERSFVIISGIIEMAKKLGIPALSKGVETNEQLEFLKRAGCELVQGYLFGRPAPSSAS